MSAHNVLQEQLVADHTLITPAAGETVQVDRSPAIINAGVSFSVSAPQAAGLLLAINNTSGSGSILVSGQVAAQNSNTVADQSVAANTLCTFISVEDSAGAVFFKKVY